MGGGLSPIWEKFPHFPFFLTVLEMRGFMWWENVLERIESDHKDIVAMH